MELSLPATNSDYRKGAIFYALEEADAVVMRVAVRWCCALGSEGAALNTSNKKGGDGEVLRHIQDQADNVGSR